MRDPEKYYVYHVTHNGILVYVGKGTGNRYLHPTSGSSHSAGLNELWLRHTLLQEDAPIVCKVAFYAKEGCALKREGEDILKMKPTLNKVKAGLVDKVEVIDVVYYNDDFSYGYLSEYKPFKNRHPAWMSKEIFHEVIISLEESVSASKALTSINNHLNKMGLRSLTEGYVEEVSCYVEWVELGMYMFGEDHHPKEHYMSIFIRKDGFIDQRDACHFLDSDGNIDKKFKPLFKHN
jgi:hypothetical protein